MSARDQREVLAKTELENQPKAVRRSRRRGGTREAIPPLCAWLNERAREYGDTNTETAAALGVTPGYIHQLSNGHRRLSGISEKFVRGCAQYLGVPPIVIKLAAGCITLEDWGLVESDGSSGLSRAMRRLHAHPRLKMISAADTAQLSEKMQRRLVSAFGESLGVNFFESRDIPSFLDALRVPALRIATAVATAVAADSKTAAVQTMG